jgi:hypothetical protein
MQKRSAVKSRGLRPAKGDNLRRVVEEEALPASELGTEIAGLFAKVGLKTDIPELRGGDCLKATGEGARHSTNNSL